MVSPPLFLEAVYANVFNLYEVMACDKPVSTRHRHIFRKVSLARRLWRIHCKRRSKNVFEVLPCKVSFVVAGVGVAQLFDACSIGTSLTISSSSLMKGLLR